MHTRAPLSRRRSAWIVIDDQAKRSFLHADKRSLIMQLGLGIPIRDMRLLDFNLLSSGALRGRQGWCEWCRWGRGWALQATGTAC